MEYICSKSSLSGHIVVPGSKSHTIRCLLLAAMSDGECRIINPLPSADCLSAAHAIKAFGAEVDIGCEVDDFGKPLGIPATEWIVKGAGENFHLPSNTIDVGNSGSTLYFFTPVASVFEGKSIFTGDESICKRPVNHLLDALRQLGAFAQTTRKGIDAPPFEVIGPIKAGKVTTDGRLSQYISGLMMASTLLDGKLEIELTDPKETPYLTMTQIWLKSVGFDVEISPNFKKISAQGPHKIKAFEKIIPSDWEGVAFPLVAAILTKSDITIDGIDLSGSQGDDEIIEVLEALGVELNTDVVDDASTVGNLKIFGSKIKTLSINKDLIEKARKQRIKKTGKCSFYFADDELHINLSGWPDAVCAICVLASFVNGTIVLEDLGVCRQKETDRLKVMAEELKKFNVDITEKDDFLKVKGSSKNFDKIKESSVFVESYDDHRVAMSFACLGFALNKTKVIINNGQCCSVSFPEFFEKMQKIGAVVEK